MRGAAAAAAAIGAVVAGMAMTAPGAQAVEPPETVYGITGTPGTLSLATITTTSGTVTVGGPISGLGATEDIVSMDFRPATGQLYAITSDNEINLISGINTAAPAATPVGMPPTITGTADIDFNPVPDAIRVVSTTGNNLRVSPVSGAVTIDTNLNGDATGASGAAYANAVAGVQQSTLYDISTTTLYRQGGLGGVPTPNGGALSNIGALGGTTTVLLGGGFDISANSGRALTLRDDAGTRKLVEVDLGNGGGVTGVTPSDNTFRAIAIQPAAAAMSFTAGASGVGEDGANATLTVRRVGNINATPSFQYTVAGSGVNPASTPADFGAGAPAGTISFAAGETSKTITIPIVNDETDELNETFTVTLAMNAGGSFGAPTAHTVTIFDDDAPVAPVGEGETVFAVDGAGQLLTFSTATPQTVTTVGAITGLDGTVTGIDVQPRTGRLFAVTSASKVYTINKATGAATQVGSAAFTPAVTGTAFGVDFNPVPNAIRFLSDGGTADQSLRISPDTGAVLGADTAPTAAVAGAAYTNSVNGANSTTLYAIDASDDQLKRIGGLGGFPSPNGGAVTPIGPLGVTTNADVGFDISGATNLAYASLQRTGDQATLHRVDLATGRAGNGAQIGNGTLDVVDIALDAQPPSVQFAAAAVSAKENAGNAVVTLSRTGNADGVSNVTVSTGTTGTATAGTDYTAVTTQAVQFAAGETTKTVSIPIADDAAVEESETIAVSVALAAASPGASLGAPNAATVTVFDNDPVTVTNTVTNTVVVRADQVLLISAPQSLRRSTLLRGLRLRASCAEACRISYVLRLGTRSIGTARASINNRGIATVTLRLTAAGRRALTSAFARRTVRSRRLTLTGAATDSDGGRSATARASITVTR